MPVILALKNWELSQDPGQPKLQDETVSKKLGLKFIKEFN